MPVKIRLQRHGKKSKPYFHIVVADGRAKRDGKSIERLGFYNPNTDPATIELNNDRALEWLDKGAVPTDTARAILSYKGVLYKKHLQKGVTKGAFDQEEADRRYEAWLEQKEGKINSKREKLSNAEVEDRKARLAAEAEVNKARAAALEAANAPMIEEASEKAAPVEEAPAVEAEEAPKEEVKAEETPEVKAEEAPKTEEAPKAEAKVEEAPEAKAEEAPEAKAEEAPKAEAKAEEAPKAEETSEDKEETKG